MLKSIILSLFIFIGINSFGQTDNTVHSDTLSEQTTSELTKMFTTKISMNIDTLVFNKTMGNIYMSDKYQAIIFTLALPQSINQAEQQFEKEKTKRKEFKLREKGKIVANGQEILYQKGTIKEDGKKQNMNIYAVKGDEKTTIFISALYSPEYETNLLSVIENAVKTAKLVKP